MSPTLLIICFIGMAIFTASVLAIGTMFAADVLPRHRRPDSTESQDEQKVS